jgi:L-lactate utilization protein LutB
MNKDFVYNYLTKRNSSLSLNDQEILREKLHQLKKEAMSQLPNLIQKAKKNLEANGVKVFVVKDYQSAKNKILELLTPNDLLVKAKSNTLDKLGLEKDLGQSLS